MSSFTADNALHPVALAWRRAASCLVAAAALLIVLVTFRPFGPPEDAAARLADGDPVNQYGFLVAGAFVVFALATLADRRVLGRLIGPLWLGVFAVLAISVPVAAEPDDALRGLALTLIASTVVSGVVLLPPGEDAFRRIFTAAALTTLGLAYASLLLVPELAIHQPGEIEAQHAGLWRGHYTHKNVAGPVMSVIALFGLYAWRSGARVAGPTITILAALFVVQTGSKTTMAFLPLAALIVAIRPLTGSAGLAVLAYFAALAVGFALTVGTVLSGEAAALVAALPGDPSFTGRTTIWRFALDGLAERPLTGFGFDGFWGSDFVAAREVSFEAPWDVRGIGSGHSNYIDMPLFFGWIGGAVVLFAFMAAPAIDYWRSQRFAGNGRLADFFMAVIVFMALTSLMESFLFNRAASFWLLVVMAVVGLRLTARLPLRPE